MSSSRDKLKNANRAAMNAVDQTLKMFNTNQSEQIEAPIDLNEENINTGSKNTPSATINSLEAENIPVQKRKRGRPSKREESARICIIVSADLRTKMETASALYGTMTDYITKLVTKDLEKNYQIYEEQEQLMKRLKDIT